MSKIKLENMEFHAYHGCLEHEQELGNTYLITVILDVDTSLAEVSDNLHDTLNYKHVYEVVKEQMNIPSKLIEHACNRIITTVFTKFDSVNKIKVRLSKLNPPLGGKVEKVTIVLSKCR
jgi:dihydroneopterin aldolase